VTVTVTVMFVAHLLCLPLHDASHRSQEVLFEVWKELIRGDRSAAFLSVRNAISDLESFLLPSSDAQV